MPSPGARTLSPRPTISVVTPSLQQGEYLEAAVRSVADQRYSPLEHVVIDGGSTDGSVDVLQRCSAILSHWSSEPDDGHYDAVDKGFALTSGDVMCWLNSDDLHLPWTLDVVAEVFAQLPDVEWLTSRFPLYWDLRGRAVHSTRMSTVSSSAFLRGQHLPGGDWPATGWIQQESTFWRRRLWEAAGAHVSGTFALAGDFDLWARFSRLATLHAVDVPLAGFRRHPRQQTAHHLERYSREALASLRRHGGSLPRAPRATRALRSASTRLPTSVRAAAPGSLRTPAITYDEQASRWRMHDDY